MHIKHSSYVLCTVDRKKRHAPINLNTYYRREMKLLPIDVDYCLLQFIALKFFLGVRLFEGGSIPNFNFFYVNPKLPQ